VVERLGLSYHNIRKLHQTVDGIPPQAEWKTRSLWFKSDPQAKHYIHHRNPIEAIQSLLGNPAHAKHIVYRPKKVFVNAEKKKRIYHEMWTGKWWNTIQVCATSV
jgi:Plavaka transposase